MSDLTDTALVVREVCRLVGDRHGDPADLVREEVRRLAPLLSSEEQHDLIRGALARLTGLGELDRLLADDAIDEVLVNADRDIWVDRSGVLEQVGVLDLDRVEHLIERVLAPLGRRLDHSSPIVDARLADGARVCAVLPPVAVDGPTLSIRRFRATGRTLEAFTDAGGCQLVDQILTARCNLLICGSTSSGKTSLVAAMLARCPVEQRLVVIEDTAELPLDPARSGRHVVRLEARPATIDGPAAIEIAALVRTALRLRPDRMVVGEIRGDEVVAFVQAMNTGHDGSISTCHANGPLDALLRLESLILQAAPTWPLAAIRHQLARSLDIVVHVQRIPGTATRRITSISEVCGPSTGPDDSTPIRAIASIDQSGRLVQMRPLQRSRR